MSKVVGKTFQQFFFGLDVVKVLWFTNFPGELQEISRLGEDVGATPITYNKIAIEINYLKIFIKHSRFK